MEPFGCEESVDRGTAPEVRQFSYGVRKRRGNDSTAPSHSPFKRSHPISVAPI